MMGSGIDALLSRLEGIRQTGAGRWVTKCPSHNDKSPSLAVRELDDGRILIHCFSGCGVHEVLDAIGLTFSDLFPEKVLGHRLPGEKRPFPASDALRCSVFEALVVAAASVAEHPLSEVDRERLILAASRIQEAARLAGVV
jgi:hypothetical protein